jgi:hypothetical protein
MYLAKNGNVSYVVKPMGSPTGLFDKCTLGWLIMGIILFLLVGPFYFFSEFSNFIQTNPVFHSKI